MHSFLQHIIPHVLMLMVLIFMPAQTAIYIFAILYTAGIFINLKKERELANAKNKNIEAKWFEVLGTSKNASISECARVRKLLTKIYHPDGGQAPNGEAMRRINKAFEARAILLDEDDIPEHIN